MPLARPLARSVARTFSRRRIGALAALAAATTGLTPLLATPAHANPAGTALVISEVYGAGGNNGAAYDADFVELYNPTDAPLSLGGLALHYRSAAGGSGGSPFALAGSVPAHGHWLVRMSATGANGAALPTPDQVATPAFSMAAAGGQVALQQGTTVIATSGETAGVTGIVDFYGASGAASYEGAPGPAATATLSVQRAADGADTDRNNADFTTAAPTPDNSRTGGGTDPNPVAATIAQVQGTGDTSPLIGRTVTTEGVVTATYPTGGFDGFYLETPGADATPGASDAVFVYGSAATAKVSVGDSVRVTGPVSEFAGTTEIAPSAADTTVLDTSLGEVAPRELAWGDLDTAAEKEAHEGELLVPPGTFTVTDNYDANFYASFTLAHGDHPLVQWTDAARPGSPEAAAIRADNEARAITLDDGQSVNFNNAANKGIALPWLSNDNPVRIGSRVTFHQPMVLEFRNSLWNLQPTHPVTDDGAAVATFTDTRTQTPEDVGGDIRLATFNVLNYFPTTGADYVAAGGTCTWYDDRAGNHITVNDCGPTGPRGAADAASLTRQQAKIVNAINKLGASIVSLEEIENSVVLGKDRDDAVSTLVDALNAAAGGQVWAYAPSPAPADLPPTAEQDVIRAAFVYKPADVALVGPSKVLTGSAAFANAREPLAQGFKPAGAPDAQAFAVVVNHFKSKGSGPATDDGSGNVDSGDGQGAWNASRVAQAQALRDFASSFAAGLGTERIFLTGDFNSYTEEDPLQVLYGAGYTDVQKAFNGGEATYSFDGLSGSLDHVLANDAAKAMVTGADVWNINAEESIAFEYSRYNYNATDFYTDSPFRASDHDPEIVGLDVGGQAPGEVTLNLVGTNDFHGRINSSTVQWAGTVEQLKAEGTDADTLFVGAGDLVGASEFASATQDDQPTIDVMNELGLDASAVGNHEFDKGWVDLRDRIIGPDGDRNAAWDYLGANVYLKGTTTPALPEYALYDVKGLQVAVVGAVTEETKTLVSPGGITDIDFGDPVQAVNRVAGELTDGDPANGEADVIVATFHAGATQGIGSSYAAEVAKGGEFAEMAGLDPSVDAIFNGHTHQVYAWDAPVPGASGRTRPILQTGEYGNNVGQIRLTVDLATKQVTSYSSRVVARSTATSDALIAQYPVLAQVKGTVDAALAHAAEVGNQPVGSITGDITTAFLNGARDDRASESTLGDLVGNALRDGIPAELGHADLGVVNPGGLRADLTYAGNTATGGPQNTDGVVTYAEANAVLPFVNNIWLVDLTGAELRQVLEQQWQPAGASRPFLALGLSDNVEVTYDPAATAGAHITSVRIDGRPLDPQATYTVSTFSFLGTGGDNFAAFTEGSHADTGLVDRDLWIAYLRGHPGLSPDFARQQVAATGLPAAVSAGDHLSATLSKLDLTSLGSPANTSVEVTGVRADGTRIPAGTATVTDGTATVSIDVPATLHDGVLTLVAQPSGTRVTIPVTPTASGPVASTVRADDTTVVFGKGAARVHVTVTADGVVPTGRVEIRYGRRVLGKGTLRNGEVVVTLPRKCLKRGVYVLTAVYRGDRAVLPGRDTFRLTVTNPRGKWPRHPWWAR